MLSVIFKFKDAEGRTVNVTVDDLNPIMEPVDIIDAGNAIAAIADYQPYGASLVALAGVTVLEKISTELEV